MTLQDKLNTKLMSVIVILSSVLIALNQVSCGSFADARAAASASSLTSTSTVMPAPVLEDSLNSATSDSTDDDSMCYRCYTQVVMTQDLIAVHVDLLKKQNNLIRQKHKVAASMPPPLPMPKSTRKPKISPNHTSTLSPTIRNRTLNHMEYNTPIVVSRLRVARSTAGRVNQSTGSESSARDDLKKNIDPALKQLKHKQKQQLNETCKSLYEVQQCLNELSRECLGNLQFHSHEVFSTQWFTRLNCPPSHDPGFKPFAALIRSIPTVEEREKVPIPRPISSQEETQKKLDVIFGGRSSTFGVMLKPTLTRSASQKFNSIGASAQQQLDGSSAVEAHGIPKGRHLLAANDIIDYNSRQPDYQLLPSGGQLFLIPCFLIIVIVFITLTNNYLKKSPKV